MDFLQFVQNGVEKSNKALAALKEVDRVFDSINSDLAKFNAGALRIHRDISAIGRIGHYASAFSSIKPENQKQDVIILSLKTGKGLFSKEVAGWSQRLSGYPCILKFDGQELSCSNETNLIRGLTELLSSYEFGNSVNELIEKSKKFKPSINDDSRLAEKNSPPKKRASKIQSGSEQKAVKNIKEVQTNTNGIKKPAANTQKVSSSTKSSGKSSSISVLKTTTSN